MKNVLIVMSIKEAMDPITRRCVDALRGQGAYFVDQVGTSDIALARNFALHQACVTLNQFRELDTVLMIDDDMVFDVEDAKKVIEVSQSLKVPVSACAVSSTNVFTGEPISKTRWATGLAFLAIPKLLLLELKEKSKTFIANGEEGIAFTWTGVEDGKWMGEDKRLTHRLGGVHIIPVNVGHLKKQALYTGGPNDIENGKLQEFLTKTLESYGSETN